MSYDVSLTIDTGGKEPREVVDCGNYTYNVAPMFAKALGGNGLRDLHGEAAWKVIPKLEVAVSQMQEHANDYRQLNPPNGWGDYDGALAWLQGILASCKENPKCIIRIS